MTVWEAMTSPETRTTCGPTRGVIRYDRAAAYRDERRKDRIQTDLRYDLQHPLANRGDVRRDIGQLDRVQYDLNRDRRDLYRDRVDRRRDTRDVYSDLWP